MNKITSENARKEKTLIFSVIIILVLVGTIYYVYNAHSAKNFEQLYDIKGEILSGRVFNLDLGNRDTDLDKNQANRLLNELKKNQYFYSQKAQEALPGTLYHIYLMSASEYYDILISDENLLIKDGEIYKIKGSEDFVKRIKEIVAK